MSSLIRSVNIPSFFALIVYPIVLLCLFLSYNSNYGLGSGELIVAVVGYYGSNISVGIGLHRLWSHNAYKTNKFVEFILMFLTAGTMQGPVLSWASNHYKHHTYTDKDHDPHTPLKFENRLLGFFWSHIGWMLLGEGSYKSIDKLTMIKLGRNQLLRFQLRYYWHLALFMNFVLPALLGFLIEGGIWNAYKYYLFIGVGRALQQQATFCVNSLCHFMGTQEYQKGTAGDIWWMAVFLLGENYHNFHHAFPSDYRNGVKWYHFDVHKWIIYCMSLVGLAWDLERTSKIRIVAKLEDTREQFQKTYLARVESMTHKTDELLVILKEKMVQMEVMSVDFESKFKHSLKNLQYRLSEVKNILTRSLPDTGRSADRMLTLLAKRLQSYEEALLKIDFFCRQNSAV